MKKHFFLITFLVSIFSIWSCSSNKKDISSLKPNENFRLNQLGYLPNSVKKAVIINSKATDFQLLDTLGTVVFSGKLEDRGVWDLSKDSVKIADFSAFEKNGKYLIYVDGLGISFPFAISNDIYTNVFNASLKAYYLQRASTAIEEKYAGKYNHPFAHPDTNCFFHPSSGKNSGSMPSPKGWHDAGDYNKYMVNAGYSVSMLLTLYEYFPEAVSDQTNIPESGNQLSDLLDEVKYELDWAETMQDKDGGVFFKLTSKTFSGFIKPQEDTLTRYVVGKSTSSALNFAAIFAQASRIWKNTDSALAEKYISSAKKAWDWAAANPTVIFKNPTDISTGEYGHSDFKGDFFWAAAELFATTGDDVYLKYIQSNPIDFTFVSGENWRNYLKNLGYYALILPETKLEAAVKENYKKAIVTDADLQLANLEQCPYRQPLSRFEWGSNSDVLDLAVIFAQAYQLSNDKKYLDAAIETTDYIFGKNAVGISFVTGFGTKSAMKPHHRLSASDGIEEPIPGWVVGGPNANLNDIFKESQPYGIKYNSTEPAKSYMDLTESYASNEIAINWNAPLVYITGFLDHYSKSDKK
jgi:endoglucanase